ncbi:MAG: DoxX family protein [Saprospiraceae bacterium]|nr:DoxX family protein [Saprospiraceae bacterium]
MTSQRSDVAPHWNRCGSPVAYGVTASLALAVFAEVFCSIFLIFGIATRFAAIPLLITMLVAALIVHSSDGFGKQELPLFYAVIYFSIAITGAGKYSVDNWLYKKYYEKNIPAS